MVQTHNINRDHWNAQPLTLNICSSKKENIITMRFEIPVNQTTFLKLTETYNRYILQ